MRNFNDTVVKTGWEKIPLQGCVAAAVIHFILYLLYCYFILVIFTFPQLTYRTSVVLYPKACLPALFSSWLQQSCTILTSETSDPAFSIADSLSSAKATSVITISGKERKIGEFFMYLTELFRWGGNTETIYALIRCIVHMWTHDIRKAVWMLPHPLSTQLLHSEVFHRWLRLFSGFVSYWGCQAASDLVGFVCLFYFNRN